MPGRIRFSAELIAHANERVETGGERVFAVERDIGMGRGTLSRYRSGKSRRGLLANAEPLPNPSEIRLTPAHVNTVLAAIVEERSISGQRPALLAVAEKLKLDPRGKQVRRVFKNSLSLISRIWDRVDKSAGPTGHWIWRGKSVQRKYKSREYEPQPVITGPRGHSTVDVARWIYAQCVRNGKPLSARARLTRCDLAGCVQPSHMKLTKAK